MTAARGLAVALALATSAGCASGTTRRWPGATLAGSSRPIAPLTARRLARQDRPGSGRPVAGAWAYRTFIAPGLGTRCRMLPSDSEYLDQYGARCGVVAATLVSVARLYLEVEASPELLRPTVVGGRVRYLDVPGPRRCWP